MDKRRMESNKEVRPGTLYLMDNKQVISIWFTSSASVFYYVVGSSVKGGIAFQLFWKKCRRLTKVEEALYVS